MLLKDFLPGPSVRTFVRWYRIVHFRFDQSAQIPAKVYPPKPETILHFFLRDGFSTEGSTGNKQVQPPITLIGQRTFVTRQYNGNDFLNFQVVFQPGALFRLTGIPVHELTNQILDGTCIFPGSIGPVFRQLQSAGSYGEMLEIGENFVKTLIAHARRDAHPVEAAAYLLHRSEGNLAVDALADAACLCPKQFKRRFHERTGINPKTYARIIRFTNAYNIRNRFPGKDWLTIATQCGYYDYQHLVKDYKDFTGTAPTAFHLLESNSPESVLGLSQEVYRARLDSIR